MSTSRRAAFTLIEVLIVVIIMAVLAATIIPQFSSSTKDAKDSSLKFNLHTMRSQVELYKEHHLTRYPEFSKFKDQMTKSTNVSGDLGTGTDYPYGPYFQNDVPANPFTGTNTLVKVGTPGAVPTGIVAGGAGWQYDESNGGLYPNNAEYYAPL
jgi:prepilin-type N-terminal cleavage/methylation domain-containing protein